VWALAGEGAPAGLLSRAMTVDYMQRGEPL
jgi:hypothetical protein